jgi:pyruvate dehydrogenase E2 component (dihydrolipoamide acetyltransferase)
MPILVKMPKWGLTMKTGTISEWLYPEGAEVPAGAGLLVVETDKINNEVEAPEAGLLRRIVAETGAEVRVSDPVAVLAAPGETLSDAEVDAFLAAMQQGAEQTGTARASGARQARESRAATRDEEGRINASPAARKLARELGVELASVTATGPGGRITSEDVQRAAQPDEVREEYLALANGQRLFYVLAGPTTRRPPLVFLHGLGGSQSTWQALLPSLVERRRVCALDLPGHGQSDKPTPAEANYSLAGLAGAVSEALAALNLSPAILVGHSLGGAVAISLALARPDLVRGLVLVDSAGLGDEISPDLLERVAAEPSRSEARRLLELFFHDHRFILDSGIDETYQAHVAPGGLEALRATAAASFGPAGQRTGLPRRLGELRMPVLIIWGAEDRVIPAAHAAAGAAAIAGARSLVLAGVGHVPQIEDADGVARAIEGFLETTAG